MKVSKGRCVICDRDVSIGWLSDRMGNKSEIIEGLLWECVCFHVAERIFSKAQHNKNHLHTNKKVPDIIAYDHSGKRIIVEAKRAIPQGYELVRLISKYINDCDLLYIWSASDYSYVNLLNPFLMGCNPKYEQNISVAKALKERKVQIFYAKELIRKLNNEGIYDYNQILSEFRKNATDTRGTKEKRKEEILWQSVNSFMRDSSNVFSECVNDIIRGEIHFDTFDELVNYFRHIEDALRENFLGRYAKYEQYYENGSDSDVIKERLVNECHLRMLGTVNFVFFTKYFFRLIPSEEIFGKFLDAISIYCKDRIVFFHEENYFLKVYQLSKEVVTEEQTISKEDENPYGYNWKGYTALRRHKEMRRLHRSLVDQKKKNLRISWSPNLLL